MAGSTADGGAARENVVVCVRPRPGTLDKQAVWSVDAAAKRIVPTEAHPSVARRGAARGRADEEDAGSGTPAAYDFCFDDVVSGAGRTEELYRQNVYPVVRAAMEGYNGTVFAYGQTGSGKTYTMSGTHEEPGVIPCAVRDMFSMIREQPHREFLLRVGYLEIYNETLRDLLAEPGAPGPSTPSRRGAAAPRAGPTGQPRILEERGRVVLSGLQEEIVTSPASVLEVLERGQAARHVDATDWNTRSSRSHTVFQITIESRDQTGSGELRVSQLNLIDLAGSERAATKAARRKEGAYINKSLLTLGTVIAKLTEPAQGEVHVPYRDSKLTRLLQTSLGGDARVAVVCTLHLGSQHAGETLSTLKFGRRCKMVVTSARRQTVMDDKALLDKYRRELEELRTRLASSEPAPRPPLPATPEPGEEPEMGALQRQRDAAEQEVEAMRSTRTELKGQIDHLTRLILTSRSVAASTPKRSRSPNDTGDAFASPTSRRGPRMSDVPMRTPVRGVPEPESPTPSRGRLFEREAAVAGARREAAQARSELEQLRAELERAQDEARSARDEAKAARDDAEVARQAADVVRTEVDAARADAEAAQQRADDAQQELDAARQAADDARDDAEAARQDADAARQEADAAREEAEAVRQADAAAGAADMSDDHLHAELHEARQAAAEASAQAADTARQLLEAREAHKRQTTALEQALHAQNTELYSRQASPVASPSEALRDAQRAAEEATARAQDAERELQRLREEHANEEAHREFRELVSQHTGNSVESERSGDPEYQRLHARIAALERALTEERATRDLKPLPERPPAQPTQARSGMAPPAVPLRSRSHGGSPVQNKPGEVQELNDKIAEQEVLIAELNASVDAWQARVRMQADMLRRLTALVGGELGSELGAAPVEASPPLRAEPEKPSAPRAEPEKRPARREETPEPPAEPVKPARAPRAPRALPVPTGPAHNEPARLPERPQPGRLSHAALRFEQGHVPNPPAPAPSAPSAEKARSLAAAFQERAAPSTGPAAAPAPRRVPSSEKTRNIAAQFQRSEPSSSDLRREASAVRAREPRLLPSEPRNAPPSRSLPSEPRSLPSEPRRNAPPSPNGARPPSTAAQVPSSMSAAHVPPSVSRIKLPPSLSSMPVDKRPRDSILRELNDLKSMPRVESSRTVYTSSKNTERQPRMSATSYKTDASAYYI